MNNLTTSNNITIFSINATKIRFVQFLLSSAFFLLLPFESFAQLFETSLSTGNILNDNRASISEYKVSVYKPIQERIQMGGYACWLQDFPTQTSNTYGNFCSLGISIKQSHYNIHQRLFINSILDNGLAYAFSPYSHKNPNTYIGGNIQIYFSGELLLTRKMGRHEYSGGVKFLHISNSGTSQPNSGLNSIMLVGRYQYGKDTTPQSYRTFSRRDHYYSLMASTGMTATTNKDFRTLNLQGSYMLGFNERHAFGIGIDYNYNPRFDHHHWIGTAFVSESFFNHFSIVANIGYYLNRSHPTNEDIRKYTHLYERIGLRYYLKQFKRNTPFISYSVKGNEFYAEQLELCIGMIL